MSPDFHYPDEQAIYQVLVEGLNSKTKFFNNITSQEVEQAQVKWLDPQSFKDRVPEAYHTKGRPIQNMYPVTKMGDQWVPARVVEYSKHPSLHACGPKCRMAKGKNCECSCGGAGHGADVQ